jgi:photosystem II stability/assembly factor-like uncharacterized protein
MMSFDVLQKAFMMRRFLAVIVLLLLGLTACAGTLEPASSPTAPMPAAPTAALPVDTVAVQPTPGAGGLSGGVVDAESTPLPGPSAPAPTAVSVSESPWPHLLRELDFGVPAGNSYSPRALAVHPGLRRIYVRTNVPTPDYQAIGTVAVLDMDTGQVLAVVEAGSDNYTEGDLAVDAAHNRVYVLSPGDKTCIVLGAETLQTVTSLDGVDRFALDAEGGRLYVAGLGALRVFDTGSYSLLRQTAIANAPRFLALAADAVNGHLFLVSQQGGDYVLAVYDPTTLDSLVTVPLPGPPDDLLPDPQRGRLYLTLDDGQDSRLWTLDGAGHLVDDRRLGEWTQNSYLALDPGGGRLFISHDAYQAYGVTILDLNTGQESGSIPLDRSPTALAWDGESGRLFVSQTYANQISAVDVSAGQVGGAFPTAVNLADLAVDPQRGYLYVADSAPAPASAGRLHVLDSETDDELAILPGGGRIAVDSPHGRFYTGGEGADQAAIAVRVFDADSLQQTGEIQRQAIPVADAHDGGLYLVDSGIYIASLETLTTTGVISDTLPEYPGFSPNPAAVDAVVDAGSGRIFAIINNGVPGSNNGNYLYVYEPVTYTRIFTDTERSASYVDVDPNTGRAYVSRIHLAGRSTSLFDPGQRAYTARLDAVFGAVRVDPALGRAYLTTGSDAEGQLLILDAQNLDVLGSVPIPSGFSLRALDPWRDLLYLAADDGRVQVWSALGGALPGPVEPVPAALPLESVRQLFRSKDDHILFAGSLYRSDDEGASWFNIGSGLPTVGVWQVLVSPEFSRDQTLYAVLMATDAGLGIWRSADGGRTWRMANRGLSDLSVTGASVSPAFTSDGTLFALTRRQGLFRSTDGGASWVRLTERYHQEGGYPEPPGLVAISPAYARDEAVFVAHYGLQRSTDGGETWTRVLPQNPESLAVSPDFADDGTLFGWFGNGGLLRSTDGGETWSPASAGLNLLGFGNGRGNGRVIVAPDFATSQTLYFLWTPSQAGTSRQLYRSTDAAVTWQQLAGEVPQGATSVDLAANGTAFLALDDTGRLARWPVADLNWQPAALPPINEITCTRLSLSPDFARDRTLLAVSEGAGILRSGDAGLTWTDTGFPLRMTLGDGSQPVMIAPGTILVGSPLGLYRSVAGGPWLPVGGGLPQGVAVSSPFSPIGSIQEDGVNGPLLVLAGSDDERLVYLSTDDGQAWAQPVPALPAGASADTLLFSPAFATDGTAFYAPSWGKPQRTLNGGAWEEFGPPGDWNLSAMAISSAFDRDGMLVMRRDDDSLWQSTDRGDTWTRIDGPWGDAAPWAVTVGTGYSLPPVTFSPSFAQDGVLLTRAGDAVYRSTDRGAKWSKVLGLGVGLSRALFSPDYARDGTIYLLQGNTLYQSTTRGQKWQALNPAPWKPDDEITFRLSPTFERDHTLLAWSLSGQVYESADGGQSWRDATAGLSAVRIHELILAPDYAEEGLVYLLPFTPGLYKRQGAGPWQAVTASESPPTPTPSPAASPTSTATPLPKPPPTQTPVPLACTSEPVRFQAVWQQTSGRFGCPSQPAEQALFAEQPFERGRMIWDAKTAQIYVLLETGTWQAFDDTFKDGVDPSSDPALVPPQGRIQPVRGFGKVWRQQLGGPQAATGWALGDERPVDGWRQRFEQGLLVWSDATLEGSATPGTAYLLYDDGTWQALPSPAQ